MNENSLFRHKLIVTHQYLIMKTHAFNILFLLTSTCAFPQSTASRIDSLMKSYYSPNLPGAVISIKQSGHSVFKKSYGLTNPVSGRHIDADDNFNIGSLTKQFTAFSILKMYFAGQLQISDPIGKFLKLPPQLACITISQLLSHSSGIPDHYRFTDTILIRQATDQDVLAALQKADTLYFPPGTRYRYSNTAYCLLGLLIEKISGLTYNNYLQKNIFKPLGILHAQAYSSSRIITNRVTGFDRTNDGRFIRSDADESIFFSTEADGGLYISMNNYMKWCTAIESGKFSRTPMIQRSWSPQTPVDSIQGLWYGNGWFISEVKTHPKIVYHTGSNGGFRTVVFMIPSLDYCISIFSNRSDIDLEDLVSGINFILRIPGISFIKSGPLESFIHSWPIFAPCRKISSYSTSFRKNLNVKDMVLN
jgi:D-alanyl-D-alanine carboxypeptidase